MLSRLRSYFATALQPGSTAKLFVQVFVLVLCTFTMLGASDTGHRFDRLGHGLVCQCSCGQILLECNHVGCPVSPVMIAELHKQMDMGVSDAGIYKFFVDKYGPIVLAAPTTHGFDLVAWIVPFAALLLATVAIVLLLSLWKRRRARLAPAAPAAVPMDEELRARIRRDTNYGE